MKKMQDKKLILIDSSGFNPTTDRLSKTLSLVNQSDFPIEPIMVLSATTQTTILVKALTEYQYLPSKRVILTKTDETFSIASALCALLKAKAPLLYLSNGQQIPEDISLANHYQLFSLLNNSLSNVSEDSSLALKELMSSLIKGDNNVQL
jgi:flagellar biosynthesis protein FlhF